METWWRLEMIPGSSLTNDLWDSAVSLWSPETTNLMSLLVFPSGRSADSRTTRWKSEERIQRWSIQLLLQGTTPPKKKRLCCTCNQTNSVPPPNLLLFTGLTVRQVSSAAATPLWCHTSILWGKWGRGSYVCLWQNWLIRNFPFVLADFLFVSCHSAVFSLWLASGNKTYRLGLNACLGLRWRRLPVTAH